MQELPAPQISPPPGVWVGLVGADQLVTVLLGVWLDLQGVLGHQQAQRHGGRRRNPVDEFGFHFVDSKTGSRRTRAPSGACVAEGYISVVSLGVEPAVRQVSAL